METADTTATRSDAATVLGIDTSTAATAVCVRRADGEYFETVPDPGSLLSRPAHATELMPEVAGQMRAAGVDFRELGCVAVGVGPGAYTGLRIGVATARMLAQAHDLEVRPVGSLAALAAGIEAGTETEAALPLIDARRGELFAALYVGGEERWAPFVTTPEALVEQLASARGEGLPRPAAAGDGSLRFRHVLEAAALEIAASESRLHVVRALHVCRLAAEAPATAPEAVTPTYLRAPDATPR